MENITERTPKHLFKDGPRFSFKKVNYSENQIRQFILTHLEQFDKYDLCCLLSISKYGTNTKDMEFKKMRLSTLRSQLAKSLLSIKGEKLWTIGDYLEAIYNDDV